MTNTVEQFLKEAKSHRCGTCALAPELLTKVEEAVMVLHNKRQHGESRYPWADFVEKYLVVQLGYPFRDRALKKHMKDCRGTTLE